MRGVQLSRCTRRVSEGAWGGRCTSLVQVTRQPCVQPRARGQTGGARKRLGAKEGRGSVAGRGRPGRRGLAIAGWREAISATGAAAVQRPPASTSGRGGGQLPRPAAVSAPPRRSWASGYQRGSTSASRRSPVPIMLETLQALGALAQTIEKAYWLWEAGFSKAKNARKSR